MLAESACAKFAYALIFTHGNNVAQVCIMIAALSNASKYTALFACLWGFCHTYT